MAQIFSRSANTLARASILGVVLLLTAVGAALMQLQRSPYVTRQHQVLEQPVPFSHKHHAAGLGIDCRYCHTSVEESGFAGIPPTKTCMNCHAQMWTNADLLAPVRYSFRTGQSIQWVRVHDLPDFVYFNHSIHVAKGVGCETCHGRVDKMPLMAQYANLRMEWCLTCHRNPEQYVRPREFVTTMGYQPEGDQEEIGRKLVAEYRIQGPRVLTSCSTCHR
jgi:Cytochrome c7 and related cytochrome c